MKTILLAAALVVAVCFAMPAQAAVWTFNNIVIDGLQETPPVATPGTGSGTYAAIKVMSGAAAGRRQA